MPVESAIDFSHVATNPLSTGQPWANALLGVYTNYSQGSTKIDQNYFYQDLSVYLQDTWKVTPRLTLDLGVRLSYYEPFYNKGGSEAYFNPALFNPAQATRLYRPVCVGARPARRPGRLSRDRPRRHRAPDHGQHRGQQLRGHARSQLGERDQRARA